jgi:hypothetical protein
MKELWLFIFIIGTLILNWPFLNIFKMSLPFYLFSIWGIFILVVAILISLRKKQKAENDI